MPSYPDTSREYDLSQIFRPSASSSASTSPLPVSGTTHNEASSHVVYEAVEDDEKEETIASLILLNRSIAPLSVFKRLWNASKHHICADGAANWLHDKLSTASSEPQSQHTSSQNQLSQANNVSVDDYIPDAIVGDLDSIRPDVQSWYEDKKAVRILCDASQYSTDFGKSLKYAYGMAEDEEQRRQRRRHENGANDEGQRQRRAVFMHNVVVRGSLSGRVDQGIGVLHELYRESRRFIIPLSSTTSGSHDIHATNGSRSNVDDRSSDIVPVNDRWDQARAEADGQDKTDVALFTEQRRLWLVSEQAVSLCLPPGTNVLKGIHLCRKQEAHNNATKEEDNKEAIFAKHCGILPVFGGPVHLTTTGLEWDVQDWRTEMGGRVSSSNHVVQDTVTVKTDRWVLFTVALDPDFLSQP